MNLPVRTALQFCNPKSLALLQRDGFQPIDGGAGKCKAIDSIFFDKLKLMGYRAREMTLMIEADWVISNSRNSEEFPNNDIVFTYINPNAGGVVHFSLSDNFTISGKKISAAAHATNTLHTIKVGKAASMNIKHIYLNQEDFK